MSQMTMAEVKAMWEQRAATIPQSDAVTHRDVQQRLLEIAVLSNKLRPTDVVLDMGCGNGWTTVQLAQRCRQIVGMDYSPEMIARAQQEFPTHDRLRWGVADVLAFQEVAQYDAIVTVRCLINIVDRELQWAAIRRLRQALRPGGRLLMMEGILDGRNHLNRVRRAVGLEAMPAVVHNLDFPVAETTAFLRTLFADVRFEANGLYDLLTRVLHPMLTHPAPPAYQSPMHQAAVVLCDQVQALPELSRFGLFECRTEGEA